MPNVMTQDDVLQKLLELVAAREGVEPASLNMDAGFSEDLDWDSLEKAEFLMDVEEAFDIHVPDERVEHINSIRQTLEALMPLLGGSA